MDSARWQRISSILDEALDLPPEKRERAIEAATAGDDELRTEVLAHLAAADEIGALDRTLSDVVGAAAAAEAKRSAFRNCRREP